MIKFYLMLLIVIVQVNSYILERQRQVQAINIFYDKTIGTDEPQVSVYRSADIPKAMLREQIVFVIEISVLPNRVYDTFQYFNNERYNDKFWYNDNEYVGNIR